ncbi:MAG: transglycosylase SLT domain-containing protein, partial [Bdellovibrionota bacterium]
TSHEVAWGASRFELKTRTLCVSGAGVTTGEADAPASIGCEAAPGIKASLSGNSTRGDLLVRIDDGSVWAFIRVSGATSKPRPPGPIPDTGGGETKPVEPEAGAILPIDLANKITEAFELDRTSEVIQERIRSRWKKSDRLNSFLSKAPARFPEMVQALKGTGVPSEILFITMIESNYFVCPGYPVDVSPVGAVGPWQFMPATAAWDVIGLKVKPLIPSLKTVKDRAGKTKTVTVNKADPDDERGDLAKSSRGAALYFKYLFQKFPSDPKLALMAYNWGPKGVNRVLNCGNDATCLKARVREKSLQQRLSAIQSAGFDFWTVRELNMAPTETLEYVVNFVSAQFVGRNPKRYDVEIPQGDHTPASLGCPK